MRCVPDNITDMVYLGFGPRGSPDRPHGHARDGRSDVARRGRRGPGVRADLRLGARQAPDLRCAAVSLGADHARHWPFGFIAVVGLQAGKAALQTIAHTRTHAPGPGRDRVPAAAGADLRVRALRAALGATVWCSLPPWPAHAAPIRPLGCCCRRNKTNPPDAALRDHLFDCAGNADPRWELIVALMRCDRRCAGRVASRGG